MSFGGDPTQIPPLNIEAITEHPLAKDCLVPMGQTAEIVAERYGVTRHEQDEMSVESHAKAIAAQASGRVNDEIVPVEVKGESGTVLVTKDDGPRAGTTIEKLGMCCLVRTPPRG